MSVKSKKTEWSESLSLFTLTLFSDPGGILTPNPQSRNLMRYTVAPRSQKYSLRYTPDCYRDAPRSQKYSSRYTPDCYRDAPRSQNLSFNVTNLTNFSSYFLFWQQCYHRSVFINKTF